MNLSIRHRLTEYCSLLQSLSCTEPFILCGKADGGIVSKTTYRLMCTTVAGGKPLNQVDEAWL